MAQRKLYSGICPSRISTYFGCYELDALTGALLLWVLFTGVTA